MKKLAFLFISSLFFISVHAQFRKIPGVVTDSFKVKYPSAKAVTWKDRTTSFQATFTLGDNEYVAKYNSKGEWQQSEKKIKEEDIPASVKDGLSKSKYADWKIGSVTHRDLPGGKVEYTISVSNGTLSKRNLTFSSEGQLKRDGITL
ncbi:MAG: PepSY-like domain-containing protein [Chitinophagaceae bacterium]|nr:PepSY-like domain-containing protein [Chitinophagaceae bacterium]